MKRLALQEMTPRQLVEKFAGIALQQEHAISKGESAKYNRLFRQMNEIEAELKSRPGDQRGLLVSLFDHPSIQVRLKAATRSLAVLPQEARLLLESIASSREYPQAADAGMLLTGLDDGTFRPT